MAEKIVALLGGDKREIEVAKMLAGEFRLRCFGLPRNLLPCDQRNICCCASVAEALSGAQAVLLPMAGVRENGLLYSPLVGDVAVGPDEFSLLKAGTPVLVGVASAYLSGMCRDLSLPLFEVAEQDLVAIPNAVPTAEGALEIIMRETEVTVSGLKALVLGFGRVGEALCLRLRALGAEVLVVNRGERRRQLARSHGFALCGWADLPTALAECDVVVNTVPTAVLDKRLLRRLNSGCLVVDLASGAGGTDFVAAGELGIRAIHAISLPGKAAPLSAGRILGRVYPRLLATICGWDDDGKDKKDKKYEKSENTEDNITEKAVRI
ncbi:MAG: NAD(P)-binding domain-containing protein [Firmicutes bacterium]|nr:NAD(P)-binding domain-containing protein [Bacillota bacterium]MBQ3199505.1 NAD(P)-binding domain-containing protein [Bacillota bacterium]